MAWRCCKGGGLKMGSVGKRDSPFHGGKARERSNWTELVLCRVPC
jgi:hypothetical protein